MSDHEALARELYELEEITRHAQPLLQLLLHRGFIAGGAGSVTVHYNEVIVGKRPSVVAHDVDVTQRIVSRRKVSKLKQTQNKGGKGHA